MMELHNEIRRAATIRYVLRLTLHDLPSHRQSSLGLGTGCQSEAGAGDWDCSLELESGTGGDWDCGRLGDGGTGTSVPFYKPGLMALQHFPYIPHPRIYKCASIFPSGVLKGSSVVCAGLL